MPVRRKTVFTRRNVRTTEFAMLMARKPYPEDPQTAIDVRFVEVKGRAGVGEMILSDNEYRTAVRLKKDYWLYAIFNCPSKPQAHLVQGPARLGTDYNDCALPSERPRYPTSSPRRSQAMTTAMQVMLKLQTMPEEQQRQVLEFIEQLPPPPPRPRVELHGLLKGYDVTDEEIAEARREMWGNSPGEDF